MSDILLRCGHFTLLSQIICMFVVISASCIRLFDRLSDLSVFPKSETVVSRKVV